MVAVPELIAVATPLLLTVATAVLLEVQLATLVISTPSVPSARVAEALNWTCDPEVVVCDPGLTAMLWMCTLPTTIEAELEEVTLPDFAVMVVEAILVPEGRVDVAVATPELPGMIMKLATLVLEDAQVTCVVTSPVE